MAEDAAFWQPDEDAVTCPTCGVSFGLLERRHHCRVCGLVFCGNCCFVREGKVLDERVATQRSCLECWNHAVATTKWQRQRRRQRDNGRERLQDESTLSDKSASALPRTEVGDRVDSSTIVSVLSTPTSTFRAGYGRRESVTAGGLPECAALLARDAQAVVEELLRRLSRSQADARKASKAVHALSASYSSLRRVAGVDAPAQAGPRPAARAGAAATDTAPPVTILDGLPKLSHHVCSHEIVARFEEEHTGLQFMPAVTFERLVNSMKAPAQHSSGAGADRRASRILPSSADSDVDALLQWRTTTGSSGTKGGGRERADTRLLARYGNPTGAASTAATQSEEFLSVERLQSALSAARNVDAAELLPGGVDGEPQSALRPGADSLVLSPFALVIGKIIRQPNGRVSTAQAYNATVRYSCCQLLRPGLLVTRVNGNSVAGMAAQAVLHLINHSSRPLTLNFLYHPLAVLRHENASLASRVSTLTSHCDALAVGLQAALSAGAASRLRMEVQMRRLAQACLQRDKAADALKEEVASLKRKLVDSEGQARELDGRLSYYNSLNVGFQRQSLALARMTAVAGQFASSRSKSATRDGLVTASGAAQSSSTANERESQLALPQVMAESDEDDALVGEPLRGVRDLAESMLQVRANERTMGKTVNDPLYPSGAPAVVAVDVPIPSAAAKAVSAGKLVSSLKALAVTSFELQSALDMLLGSVPDLQEIEGLEDDARQRAMRTLSLRLLAVIQQRNDAVAEARAAKATAAKQATELSAAQAEMAKLREEMAAVRAECTALRAAASADSPAAALTEELRIVQQQLTVSQAAYQDTAAMLQHMNSRAVTLKRENQRLRSLLAEVRAGMLRDRGGGGGARRGGAVAFVASAAAPASDDDVPAESDDGVVVPTGKSKLFSMRKLVQTVIRKRREEKHAEEAAAAEDSEPMVRTELADDVQHGGIVGPSLAASEPTVSFASGDALLPAAAPRAAVAAAYVDREETVRVSDTSITAPKPIGNPFADPPAVTPAEPPRASKSGGGPRQVVQQSVPVVTGFIDTSAPAVPHDAEVSGSNAQESAGNQLPVAVYAYKRSKESGKKSYSSWAWRYFRRDGDVLAYYRSEFDVGASAPQGRVDLLAELLDVTVLPGPQAGKALCLQLRLRSGKEYQLSFASKAEREQWADFLTRVAAEAAQVDDEEREERMLPATAARPFLLRQVSRVFNR